MKAKKIIFYIILLQIAILGLILTDAQESDLQVLQQVLGFIFLTFIPGLLIVGLLKISTRDFTETLVYSIGLSLASIMGVTLVINIIYPHFGIRDPFSPFPLFMTFVVINLILCILLYVTNRDFDIKVPSPRTLLQSPFLLTCLMLPFVSVIGATVLDQYNNNTLLLILYGTISVIPLLVVLGRVPEGYYPFIVWLVSLSLLLSVPLSTRFLTQQSDALIEYFFANGVLLNYYWDGGIQSPVNSMLRVVILHPVYSIILNLDLINEFKIVHPLLYSFTPVVLYMGYRKIVDNRMAFLSTFLLMFSYLYFVTLSKNTRNGIAELFVALFLLVVLSDRITNMQKSILSIIFASCIVASHYATAFVFMYTVLAAVIMLYLLNITRIFISRRAKTYVITPAFSVLYVVLLFVWYNYSSGSALFNLFVNFNDYSINAVVDTITSDMPYSVYSLSNYYSLSVELSKYIYMILVFLICVGLFKVVVDNIVNNLNKINLEYSALAFSSFAILVSTLLPFVGLGSTRVFHLMLCFLAPFTIIGVSWLFKLVLHNTNKEKKVSPQRACYVCFALLLIPILLFDSGFIAETITKENDFSPNILMSKARAQEVNNTQFIRQFNENYITNYEDSSATWIAEKRNIGQKIYLDSDVLSNYIGPSDYCRSYSFLREKDLDYNGYIYLRTYNIERNIAMASTYPPKIMELSRAYPIGSANYIYSNGGSQILFRS